MPLMNALIDKELLMLGSIPLFSKHLIIINLERFILRQGVCNILKKL